MPRPRKEHTCANPLFLKWLAEWVEQAIEQTKTSSRFANSKAHYTLKKAHDSMAKYPLPLASGLDAKCLEGIGEGIAGRLQKKLEEHLRQQGLPVPQAESEAPKNVPVPAPVKKKRKPASSSQNERNGDEDKDEGTGPKSKKSKPSKAAYVPRYRSGAYAILLTLLKARDSGREGGVLSKSVIIKEAQLLCDSSFDTAEPGKFYTAWNSMTTLIEKDLVYRNGLKFCLTEGGIDLATQMKNVTVSKQGGIDTVAEEDRASVARAPVSLNASATKASASREPLLERMETRVNENLDIPFQFWYLSVEERRVRKLEEAEIRINDVTFDVEYTLEYHPLQRNHPFTACLRRAENLASPDGNLIAYISETHAKEVCPGIDVRALQGGDGTRSLKRPPSQPASSTSSISSTTTSTTSSNSSITKKPTLTPTMNASALPTNTVHRDAVTLSRSSTLPATKPANHLMRSQSAPSGTTVEFPSVTPIRFDPGTFDILCLVDSREVRTQKDRNYMPTELARRGIDCEQRVLEVGDIAWIARHKETDEEIVLDYVLERKRLDDLVSSIKDGRFLEQKFRLDNSGVSHVIYLIEEYNMQCAIDFGLNAIYSAMASTLVANDYFVKRTSSVDETVSYLIRMTRMLKMAYASIPIYAIPKSYVDRLTFLPLQRHLDSTVPRVPKHHVTFAGFQLLNSKTGSLTLRDLLMKFLMCIRGIGAEKAQELANKYGTPRGLMEAFDTCPEGSKEKEQMLLNEASKSQAMGRKKLGAVLSKKVCEIWCSRSYDGS